MPSDVAQPRKLSTSLTCLLSLATVDMGGAKSLPMSCVSPSGGTVPTSLRGPTDFPAALPFFPVPQPVLAADGIRFFRTHLGCQRSHISSEILVACFLGTQSLEQVFDVSRIAVCQTPKLCWIVEPLRFSCLGNICPNTSQRSFKQLALRQSCAKNMPQEQLQRFV